MSPANGRKPSRPSIFLKAAQIKDLGQRRTFVYKTLTTEANSTQAGLRQTLDRFGIHYTPYYLVNAMEVNGSAVVRLYLLSRPEVDRIIPSPRLRAIPQLTPPMSGDLTSVLEDPGWNITMIGADKVWKDFGADRQGYRGWAIRYRRGRTASCLERFLSWIDSGR